MSADPEALLSDQHMRLKQCRHGPMLYNALDIYVGRSFDLYGEFSHGEADVFDQVLRPGMVALDVGANIGAHTIVMARAVGPKGVIIAFEPQRVVFQMLCANMALNVLENVRTFHAAAGAEAGEIVVPNINYAASGNFGGVSLGQYENGESVGVRTLDSLSLSQCQFIKIDAEGMENEVLKGAGETLSRFRPVLYVENDRREHSSELIERLFSADYRLYWHRPPLFNPDNFFANSENVFENLVSGNMLCLPKENTTSVAGLPEITSSNVDF